MKVSYINYDRILEKEIIDFLKENPKSSFIKISIKLRRNGVKVLNALNRLEKRGEVVNNDNEYSLI